MITHEAATLTLDPQVEDEVRSAFIEDDHSKSYPNGYVETLMDVNSTVSRFNYFYSVVGPGAIPPSSPIMISGFSLVPRMIIARRFASARSTVLRSIRAWSGCARNGSPT